MKKQLTTVLFSTAILFCGHAFSASLSLSPATQTVNVGDLVSLDLDAIFSDDPTLGGGIDIFYDASVLRFEGFTFDSELDFDPAFTRQPDELANELEGIAFGNFNGVGDDGRVGTLTFTAIRIATDSVIDIAITDNALAGGPFISATDFTSVQSIELTGASVSAVPLPAAAWLFVSAVGLLAATRRRNDQAETRIG